MLNDDFKGRSRDFLLASIDQGLMALVAGTNVVRFAPLPGDPGSGTSRKGWPVRESGRSGGQRLIQIEVGALPAGAGTPPVVNERELSFMLVIRPIEQRDFAGLKTCAIESGTGMTSLPVNDELLQRKIDASTQTFLDKPAGKGRVPLFLRGRGSGDRGDGRYLRHRRGGRPVPGVLQLSHRQGGALPPSSASTMSWKPSPSPTTTPAIPELCTLFLRECAREGLNGRLLSKHRFLFMAEHPELFDSTVFAEMRGVSDGNGHSPFYEWLQNISSRWIFPPSTI